MPAIRALAFEISDILSLITSEALLKVALIALFTAITSYAAAVRFCGFRAGRFIGDDEALSV